MMKIPVDRVSDIGDVVRAMRKHSGIRQDDVAGSVGVSHVYLRDLERGKETAQIGRALQVLAELGVRVALEIPDSAYARLSKISARHPERALPDAARAFAPAPPAPPPAKPRPARKRPGTP